MCSTEEIQGNPNEHHYVIEKGTTVAASFRSVNACPDTSPTTPVISIL